MVVVAVGAPTGAAESAPPAAVATGAPWVVWAGAVGVTSVTAWLAVVGLINLFGEHELGRAVVSAQAQMLCPVFIGIVGLVFLAERFWPAVPRPALARAHLTDAGYLGVYALVGPLVTLLNTGFAVTVERYAHFLMLRRLPLLPQVGVVALILVGMDGANWLAHVANHRSAPLWRFHALHHSQEDMSVLTTFRTHPLAHASYLPALLPVLVLEASGTLPAAGLIVYGCLVTLPHANLRWAYGPLGRVVVSPAFHRLHHAAERVDGLQTVNFGFALTVWDRLAGTAVFPRGDTPVRTGIAGRPVPVEQSVEDRALWRVLVAQLGQPLRLRSGLEEQP